MDCQKASLLMMEYIDGTISDTDKDILMKHLKECEMCSEEFSLIKESVDLVENMEEMEPPEDIEKLVMNNIATDKYKTKEVNTNIIITLLSLATIMGGLIFAIGKYKVDVIKDILVSAIVNIINFMVITLPKIVMFIDGNLILTVGILGLILASILSALMIVAIAEVYFIKKIGIGLRRG